MVNANLGPARDLEVRLAALERQQRNLSAVTFGGVSPLPMWATSDFVTLTNTTMTPVWSGVFPLAASAVSYVLAVMSLAGTVTFQLSAGPAGQPARRTVTVAATGVGSIYGGYPDMSSIASLDLGGSSASYGACWNVTVAAQVSSGGTATVQRPTLYFVTR